MMKKRQFKHLILERDRDILQLAFNKPQRLNSMTVESLEELIQAINLVREEKAARALIVTGKGRAFCSGADMSFIQYLQGLKTSADFRHILRDIVQKAMNCLEELEVPVIAAVNGPAVGGGAELALACDFRIASEKARFIFPEVRLGFIPDGGAIPRLVRLLGYGKAKDLIMTGRVVEAEEAERIGLVNKCVPPDELMTEALSLGNRLSECSPTALGVAKRMIDHAMDVDLATSLSVVGFAQADLLKSAAVEEGVRAFLEKRKPRFEVK